MVGKLDRAMYGARDAPATWQAELEKTMSELGFRPVVSSLCMAIRRGEFALWMI